MKVTKNKKNPNGANQYIVDPRQALFLSYFLNPKSDTFSNALQSAVKAGYELQYAENITALMPDWLSVKLGEINRAGMLGKAERNLNKIADMETGNNPALLRIQSDVSQFLAERLGKKIYSKEEKHLNLNVGISLSDLLNGKTENEKTETE